MKQQALYKIVGMQRDVADSGMDKQHAYDLHNMRLRHSDTNTVSALVNEIGNIKARTSEGYICNIRGTVIGSTVLNDIGILFTHEEDNTAYTQIDTIADEETNPIVLNENHHNGGILRAPNHPLHGWCCDYYVMLPNSSTVRQHRGDCELNFDVAAGSIIVLFVNIMQFNNPSSINSDGVIVSASSSNGTITLEDINGGATTTSHNYFAISKDVAEEISGSDDYHFNIIISVPGTYTEGDHLTGSVVIDPGYVTPSDAPADLINSATISFDCPIVAMEPVIPVDEPEIPEGYDIPDYPVICDYPEETTNKQCDHIYLITIGEREDQVLSDYPAVNVEEYFRGCLNFDAEHPIECTVYFENEEVKKVYWVDGLNPLRYANIAHKNGTTFWSDNLMFDSVPLLHLQEHVEITRNTTGGVFPSCTVQWCFTYLNRYGAESNIAWISPIHYSSPDDRGGAPGENCSNSFTIKIDGYEPDGRFDYIRLYSIVHTTLDAEVQVRRIADIAIPAEKVSTTITVETEGEPEQQEVWYYPSVVYTDSNTTGETVDPNELLYLGGLSVIPNTIEQKSNTLFLGNLKQSFDQLRDILEDQDVLKFGKGDVTFRAQVTDVPEDVRSGYYSHQNQLVSDSWNITSFRRGEMYRFGFQAQDKTGHWSDVWWVCDKENTGVYPTFSNGKLNTVEAAYTIPSTVVDKLRDKGYQKVRPVVVYPEPWERNIYTEGLLNPTVYNVKDRASNAPFAQSSWFLRPFPPIVLGSTFGVGQDATNAGNGDVTMSGVGTGVTYKIPFPEHPNFESTFNYSTTGFSSSWMGFLAIDSFTGYDFSNLGSPAEYRHNYPLGDSQQRNGEVQSMYNLRPDYSQKGTNKWYNVGKYEYASALVPTTNYDTSCASFVNRVADFFFVDQSILTMNSADLEFDQVLQAQKLSDYSFRVIGFIPISSFVSSYDITTNTPPNKFFTKKNDSMLIPCGFYSSETVAADMNSETGHGYKSFINGAVWVDDLAWNSVRNEDPDGADENPDVPKPTILHKNKGSLYLNEGQAPVGFAVYPWHGTGSLNNDGIGIHTVYDENDSSTSRSRTGNNYISAELKQKTLANLHYSYRTYYINDLAKSRPITSVAKTVLDEQQVSLTKIDRLTKITNSKFNILNYFGSVDKLIVPVFETLVSEEFSVGDGDGSSDTSVYPMSRKGGYPIMVSCLPYMNHNTSEVQLNHLAFKTPYTPLGTLNVLNDDLGIPSGSDTGPWKLKRGSDRKMTSIPIKYKSCNHFVVALDYSNSTQQVLSWGGIEATNTTSFGSGSALFWYASNIAGVTRPQLFDTTGTTVSQLFDKVDIRTASSGNLSGANWILFDGDTDKADSDPTKDFGHPQGYLYMGQLYRTGIKNRFGGDSDEALEQNVWLPAGEAIYLKADESVQLVWQAGDTYYQRYDALRTYPFTEEDVNKVVDIVSFMTETHINIDGRYDKNRGLTNNNHCRPTNFNKMNYVYSQRDNFFTYHALNPKKVHLDTFNYSFTWSLTKKAGALRDEWTRVTLANTYDCDGNKGSLNSITRLDNNLVAFQDGGVAQILFNENVQIQGSEGVPIELANSGKMQGLRYYTTEIGCQNKWSIAVFPNGIYWVDGRIRELCALGGEGIVQISQAKLMSTWFNGRQDLSNVWNPKNWSGFLSNCDKLTGELFITGKDSCLCFDTSIGEFSSFYDYQQTGAMLSLSGNVLTVAQDREIIGDPRQLYNKPIRYDHIWLHRKNKSLHCNLYGMQYPAYVEVVCNSNNQGSDYGFSKIFDNMSWRSDAWKWNYFDKSWSYKPFITVTNLSGFNDYQHFRLAFDDVNGECTDDTKAQLSNPRMPINLRKKFKVWYTTIPRSDESKTEARPTGTDRIRDTWCHIRLTANTSVSAYRHIIHDLSITYFIP